MSWNLSNMLKCNPKKTEVIHFLRFSLANPIPSIKVGDCSITPSNEVKDLGVTLDRHLTLKTHINNICRSASRSITKLEKLGAFYPALLRNVLFMHLFLQNVITATAFFSVSPPTS